MFINLSSHVFKNSLNKLPYLSVEYKLSSIVLFPPLLSVISKRQFIFIYRILGQCSFKLTKIQKNIKEVF